MTHAAHHWSCYREVVKVGLLKANGQISFLTVQAENIIKQNSGKQMSVFHTLSTFEADLTFVLELNAQGER